MVNVMRMRLQLAKELILLTLNGMKVVATKITPDMVCVQHLSVDASTIVTLTYTVEDGWNIADIRKTNQCTGINL